DGRGRRADGVVRDKRLEAAAIAVLEPVHQAVVDGVEARRGRSGRRLRDGIATVVARRRDDAEGRDGERRGVCALGPLCEGRVGGGGEVRVEVKETEAVRGV